MKTNIIEVDGMLSALSARGVEKQLMNLLGIKKVEVNYVNSSATVIYDEEMIGLNEIKLKVQMCGYHCSGESLPKHVCQVGSN